MTDQDRQDAWIVGMLIFLLVFAAAGLLSVLP
jgi:hypothetical protein